HADHPLRTRPMYRPRSPGSRGAKRPGKLLVLFALLLPALLGLLGLVIDGGLVMAAQRQTQNAADAAALAPAFDLLRGQPLSTARAPPTPSARQHNGLGSDATVLANYPQSGPYTGDTRFVEVFVTYPVHTLFIQVLGVNDTQSVTARAVAGYEG